VVHLYLGLFLGGAFALLGLTGSFLVFYPEIDAYLNPALQVKHEPQKVVSVQQYFDQLHVQFPNRQGVWRLELPRSQGQPVFARYLKPEEKDPAVFAPLVVAMHPVTGEIINARFWGEYVVTWVYDLHYSLLSGQSGKIGVSVLGVALFVSLGVGFFLWLPRGQNRILKAMPKVRSGKHKSIYDLHGYTGAYGLCLLFVMAVTGIGMATPQWIEPIVYQFSNRWIKGEVESEVPSSQTSRIGADKAISISLDIFPAAKVRWIEAPANLQGTYMVRLKQAAEPSDRFPKTFVWIDQFSGKVLAVRDAMKVSPGDVFFDWLHPVHNGEVFGAAGRWLAFLAGWLPVCLWMTGLIRWRQKINARHLSNQNR